MLIGRDRRHRLVVSASLLLGLLGALLGCMGTAAAAPDPAPVLVAGTHATSTSTAGPAAAPAQPPGCGQGARDNDRDAHPGTPPRGSSPYELLPALHQAGGPSGPGVLPDRVFLGESPLPAPPPAAPPTPVALSVLRV